MSPDRVLGCMFHTVGRMVADTGVITGIEPVSSETYGS